MTARVALVLVSHSHALATGTVELAEQMAPDVELVAVGGLPDGGIGTSFDRVASAVGDALAAGKDVVLLADLGSAMLTVDSALELIEDEGPARALLADAPFVEGAVAAAVTAQGGGDLAAVLASAERAGATFAPRRDEDAASRADAGAATATRTATVRNALGLHARPAAVLARIVSELDATVLVDGVDGASVLELMKLGATGGRVVSLQATGPDAQRAVDAVAEVVESGFGEA